MSATLLDTAAKRPLVIAHRGASRRAPENTMAAFSAAIHTGCDAVELDIRRLADGVLVVHHAAARRGTPLSALTYAELQHRSRHRPPRLEEVVELCADRIGLDVELKEHGTEREVLGVLAQRFSWDRLLITSFHDDVIASVKRLNAEVPCGLLVAPVVMRPRRRRDRDQRPAVERAMRCSADLLLPHQLLLPLSQRRRERRGTADLVSATRGAGLAMITWTVNSGRRMRAYLGDPDVAGIITDVPEVAMALRRRTSPALPPLPS